MSQPISLVVDSPSPFAFSFSTSSLYWKSVSRRTTSSLSPEQTFQAVGSLMPKAGQNTTPTYLGIFIFQNSPPPPRPCCASFVRGRRRGKWSGPQLSPMPRRQGSWRLQPRAAKSDHPLCFMRRENLGRIVQPAEKDRVQDLLAQHAWVEIGAGLLTRPVVIS